MKNELCVHCYFCYYQENKYSFNLIAELFFLYNYELGKTKEKWMGLLFFHVSCESKINYSYPFLCD